MKFRIILLYFSLLTSTTVGQTIDKLEYDLSRYSSSEEYGDKIEKAWKLQKLDPFNYIAAEYICRYYKDREIDSVSIYFDNLISEFPKNTEPYFLRSELLFLEMDYRDRDNYNRNKIKYLTLGLNINSEEYSIVYEIAEVYYSDFMFPLKKEDDFGFIFVKDDNVVDSTIINKKEPVKVSTFEHVADSALKYFYELWKLNTGIRENIYYPIRQLECYLNPGEHSRIPIEFEATLKQCYFPSAYFANLGAKWEYDLTTDYLFEIETAIGKAEWLETQLADLKEYCLFNKKIEPNTVIYRFTWLRSFDYPIAVRIENNQIETKLFWKVGKGSGGYEPRGLKNSGKKTLAIEEWRKFEKLVTESKFDSLPNNSYVPMNDGASWTLERKNHNSFKAHHTNSPNTEFSDACLYLIGLTDVKLKDEQKY